MFRDKLFSLIMARSRVVAVFIKRWQKMTEILAPKIIADLQKYAREVII